MIDEEDEHEDPEFARLVEVHKQLLQRTEAEGKALHAETEALGRETATFDNLMQEFDALEQEIAAHGW
jgi:uncharacterized protein YdcH (DUF465 family)